jgi:hypothetical protein
MKNALFVGIGLCLPLFISSNVLAMSNTIPSPDGNLKVTFELDDSGAAFYSVQLNGKDVIAPSSLGLVLGNESFAENLTLEKRSRLETVEDAYTLLTGKRKECSYRANRRVFSLKNAQGNPLQIIFQVSNDGAAFRYAVPDAAGKTLSVTREKTAFAFAPTTVAWLQPMPPGKSGWSRTQPSYEEYYINGPVGQPSPMSDGWCFPALFKTADDIWVLICDSDVDENYCAARLAKDSPGGVYHVAFPHPEEHHGSIDPVAPVVAPPFQSPWRVLIVGSDLNTVIASTLMTDVATPCKLADTGFIKPGKAAWHWLRYGDKSATLAYANRYLDFAANMKWEYTLIDANWDQSIGYEKMAAFVKEAAAQNVDVLLWYNSNGPWNDVALTPKDKMHDPTVRRQEFARLRDMGVKGVKIDFFGGDKQATMKLYLDILKDGADYGIMVNCHGATIPRGWQRTYPNLITMEAVRGMEACTFDQADADKEPQHCCVLPFTRNAIGSMDFTPMVFHPKIRGATLVTTPAFELALSVVFESGIQHFGLSPEEYDGMPDYVVSYLQNVPTVWDETRLVDGYPGQFVVMARRSGDRWYIGGINGAGQPKEVALDLSFLTKDATAALIIDGPDRTFIKTTLDNAAVQKPTLKMPTNGGFVIVAE